MPSAQSETAPDSPGGSGFGTVPGVAPDVHQQSKLPPIAQNKTTLAHYNGGLRKAGSENCRKIRGKLSRAKPPPEFKQNLEKRMKRRKNPEKTLSQLQENLE